MISVTGHAVERWRERVSKNATFDAARQEIEAFMASASIEGVPRKWMLGEELRQRRLARHGDAVKFEHSTAYAYNDEWGGVCLVLVKADAPFIVTVVTRAEQGQAERRLREVEAVERRHQRVARQSRYHRSFNTGS